MAVAKAKTPAKPRPSRSKTGDPACSAAARLLALGLATAASQKQLGACRAASHAISQARLLLAAGKTAKAQHLAHLAAQAKAGKAITKADRTARARELVAARSTRNAAKAAAAKVTARPPRPTVAQRLAKHVEKGSPVYDRNGYIGTVPKKSESRIASPGLGIEAASEKQRGFAEDVRRKRATAALRQAGAHAISLREQAKRMEREGKSIPKEKAVEALKKLRDKYREARAINRMTRARDILG